MSGALRTSSSASAAQTAFCAAMASSCGNARQNASAAATSASGSAVSLPEASKSRTSVRLASTGRPQAKHTSCHHRLWRQLAGRLGGPVSARSARLCAAMRAARLNASTRPSGFADVAADDVEGAAARAGRHGHRQPAVQRDAAVEAHELHRDLPLVVVHRHHRVEVAAARREKHGVGRQRTAGVDAVRDATAPPRAR